MLRYPQNRAGALKLTNVCAGPQQVSNTKHSITESLQRDKHGLPALPALRNEVTWAQLENAQDTTTMENRMAISQKINSRTAIWHSNPTLGHISGQNFPQKRHMHLHVHCSAIHNPNVHRQMIGLERCDVYTYTIEYYSAIKRTR